MLDGLRCMQCVSVLEHLQLWNSIDFKCKLGALDNLCDVMYHIYVVATMALLHAYHCRDSACLRLQARMLHVCFDVASMVNLSLHHRCPRVSGLWKAREIVFITLIEVKQLK